MKTVNMPGKISSVVSYCASGSLICWGSVMDKIHHLDWQTISVVGGLVIGVITCASNFYFKRRQTRAYESQLSRGIISPPPQED
ncbi:class II holin family protein [Rosenbergiella nectarea]|uniref:class II holin family protein n=1 Tax=Rosenbergiella nectarea TaxID=988801 RepID=UPI000B876DE9|nr:class II holin family protein [Rosenbergiella nectarea]